MIGGQTPRHQASQVVFSDARPTLLDKHSAAHTPPSLLLPLSRRVPPAPAPFASSASAALAPLPAVSLLHPNLPFLSRVLALTECFASAAASFVLIFGGAITWFLLFLLLPPMILLLLILILVLHVLHLCPSACYIFFPAPTDSFLPFLI